jgi:hypothetical protein
MRSSTVRAATVVFVTVRSLTPSAIAGQGARPAVPQTPPVRTTAWASTRTPWGDPDLQGVYTNYHELNVPFERPARFEGRNLNDISEQELAEFTQELNQKRRQSVEANIFRPLWNGKNFDLKNSRAWLVVDPQDGKVPPLTPSAQERDAANVARRNRPPADSVADLNLWYRCITRGLPGSMMPSVDEQPYTIVQAPGVVTISYEMIHETRVIPLDGRPHVGSSIRMYMGDARGHWDGQTLVVETTNFTDQTPYRGSSKDLHLIERFTPTSPTTIEWAVTLDDRSSWTRPWTLAMTLRKDASQRPFEYACHEGNRDLLSDYLTNSRIVEPQN